MIKEHSAGAVLYGHFVNDETKFLLLHYASGHWDFPKGNVEAGETELERMSLSTLPKHQPEVLYSQMNIRIFCGPTIFQL